MTNGVQPQEAYPKETTSRQMSERDTTELAEQLHAIAVKLTDSHPAYGHAVAAIGMALSDEPGFDNAALHLAHFLKDAPAELLDRAYAALSVLEQAGTDMDAVHAMRRGGSVGDGA
jgi:hypothetical protein